MNSVKSQNDRILKEELPRLVGAQYATGDQWRNNSKKNEGLEPKQKQYPAVDVTGAVLGCNLKNDRVISIRLQGKPFNITVIQVYAPTSNAEEAEVEQFYEDLQDLLELTPQKDVLFIIGDWNAKVGTQETPGVQANLALECGMKQGKD